MHEGINHTVNQIDTVQDQIETIRKSMGDLTALHDDLIGEGGEALRAFFEECHQPFLIFMHQSLVDYANTLNDIQNAVESFESNESGYVSQNYLENDVDNAFDNVEKKTIELTDEANLVIEDIQDIVTVEKLNESEVVNHVQRGKKKAQDVVESLQAMDKSQAEALEADLDNLNDMMNYVTAIETKLKNGDMSVKEFNFEDLIGIDAYQSIMEAIYDSETIEPLLEKLSDGETLSPLERDILYIYFQKEYLTPDMKSDLEDIAGFFNGNDIGKLEARLNDRVVTSQEALENEMEMVQAYLYLGTKSPNGTEVDGDTRAKMEAYLMMLKDYHSSIAGRDEVIMVGQLDYKQDHDGISGHYLEYAVKSYKYDAGGLLSKDDYRELRFYDDSPGFDEVPALHYSSVTYATGEHASSNISHSELNKLKNENAWYDANFIATRVLDKVISSLAKKADVVGFVEIGKAAVGYEKAENEREISTKEALNVAERLNLEISISEKSPGKEINIQLYPQEETFKKVERWKELHAANPNIDFPEDAVNEHDWYKMGETLYNLELDLEEHSTKIINYISSGDKGGEDSIEDLVKGIE